MGLQTQACVDAITATPRDKWQRQATASASATATATAQRASSTAAGGFFQKKPPPTTPRKLLQLSWRLLSRKGRGDNPDAVVKVLMMIVMMFEAKPIVGEEKKGKKERENVGPSSSKGQREEIVTKRKVMKKKGRGKGGDKRQDKRDGRCSSKQSPKRRPPKKGTTFRTAGTIPMIARTGSTDNNGRVPKKAVPLVPFDCSSTSFLPCIERAADGRARN